jgi:hypothetical protein
MKSITATVCLQVSVHTAYLAWIRLDAFRTIITRLCRPSSVAPLRPGGDGDRVRPERRQAQLIERVPDQYLAWRDQGEGAPTSTAEFEPLSEHGSRITVSVNLENNGALPATAHDEVRLALLDFKARTERGARPQAMR